MEKNKGEVCNISFDEHAYLSREAERDRQTIRKNNSEIFELSKRINKIANTMKFELSIDQNNQKQKIMCGLFFKVIKSFNSAIILYEYGLEQDAIAISRIMIENIFKFAAIHKNEEFYKNYILEYVYGPIKLRNKVAKNPEKHSDGYLQEIEEEIKKLGIHNTKKPRSYKTREVAELAEMEDSYSFLYDPYSSYVHSDVKSISEFFYYLEDEMQFDILPKTKLLKPVLASNVYMLCRILIIWNEIFDLEHGEEFEDIDQKVDEIFEELNKQPSNKK